MKNNAIQTFIFFASLFSLSLAGYSQATISGPGDVCFNSNSQYTYTATGLSGSGTYSWSLPSNMTLVSGSGQSSITVKFKYPGMGGQLSVTRNGASAYKSINVYQPPSGPGITGPSEACLGQTGVTYSLAMGPISTYPWFATNGATITSGSNGSSITVSFSSSFSSATIGITPVNGPCTQSTVIKNVTPTSPPATPGAISGPSVVTPGTVGIPYSVNSVSGATSYQWNLPSGATISSGAGTNTVGINFSTSFTGGNITVRAANAVCSSVVSAPKTITLTGYPEAAGSIVPQGYPCIGPTGATVSYFVSPINNASSYQWTISGGATPVGGTTSSSITLNFPPDIEDNSITISVRGVNQYGEGPSSTLIVPVYKPTGQPQVVMAPQKVCPGQTNVVYQVEPVGTSQTIVWVPTSNISPVGSNTGSTVNFNFSSSFTSDQLRVFIVNGPCGAGPDLIIPISTVPSIPHSAQLITGNSVVCQGTTGVTYTVPEIDNATSYVWSLPPGATIVSGQNTNSITVDYSASASSGAISVYGTNCLGSGVASSKQVVVNVLPGTAGVIEGSATPCQWGVPFNYSVPPIANATGYSWTVPSGATILSGNNTNAITVIFSSSASPGNITVRGTNCKGNGTSSSKAITYVTTGLGAVAGDRIEPSVDLATGIMRTSIPLFTISDGDIHVPGVLTYSATGVRVTDDDGLVGHNWSLSAQHFQISREVRGLPDDYSASSPDNRKGWLNSSVATAVKNFVPSTDENPATCSDEVANYNTLNTFDYNQDTEPDVFYVSAPGLSFQFYFDENKIPRALPYQDVIITPNTTTGPIASFTVKDARGVLYTFAATETVTKTLHQAPSTYYLVRQTHLYKDPITYTTAWRLSSMTSPIYGNVNFTYRPVTLNDPNLLPRAYRSNYKYIYNYPNELNNAIPALFSVTATQNYSQQTTIQILDKVSSPSMEAVFSSSPKYPGSLSERLHTIRLFDKREGTAKLVKIISLTYDLVGTSQRAFLTGVSLSAGCLSADYLMDYYPGELPSHDNTYHVDDWDFFKAKGGSIPFAPYSESVIVGTLKRINYPYKGYDVFFYEPHDYWNDGTVAQGAGLRLAKMISYDGTSSTNDRITEYEYKRADGQSSGKLQYKAQHNFFVLRHEKVSNGVGYTTNRRYREYTVNYTPPLTPVHLIDNMFTIQSNRELSHHTPLNGSAVAYERVVVKHRDAGQSIYEFDLPASFGDATANNGEWKASKVSIARPSAGLSACYELGNIAEGNNRYPFPPDPNYDFARALLKKVTDQREDGVTVRDVVYNYQRVYGNGSSIQKIYGLALEEMPTYYFNNLFYQDAKMFLYSKYEVFADVKTELSSQIETIYNSVDLSKKTVVTTSYFFDSPNHKELTRVETTNSDGSVVKDRLKYVNDYMIPTPTGAHAVALANLKTAHRNPVVESWSTKSIGGIEKTIEASLTVFHTFSDKVYPHQQYSFQSMDGITSFAISSVSAGSTFQFDQSNYVLENTISKYDNFGNAIETIGRNRVANSIAYGYNGTLPVIQFSNAKISEFRYSDFETITPADFFITWPAPTYGVGRNSSKGLNIPVGDQYSNTLLNSISYDYNKPGNYILSVWIKATAAGNLSVWVGAAGNSTFTFPYTASSDYKYYRFSVPVAGVVGTTTSFMLKVWSSVAVQIDDIAFYPEYADFVASTYTVPNGKNSETDSRGISNYYDHDVWGRLKTVYDLNKNVVKKIDYKVRP